VTAFNVAMRAVGVKQLKARLSEYLRLANGGETILVTDRDQVVAELRPAPRRLAPPPDSIGEVINSLAVRGEVTRAGGPEGPMDLEVRGLGLPTGTASDFLDQVRSDR
jgi:antitoxin (DNA-binding transcriptional repressor) of toxin-antitoxin stability system